MKHKVAHLRRNDPILGAAIKKLGVRKFAKDPNYFKLPRKQDHFQSLVVAIANQQISGKAADTILARFVALFPGKKFPTPKDVLKMSAGKIRKAGLSKMKVSFLKDLSRRVLDGTVNFKEMPSWSDEEVIEHLVAVKGIGRWTAEMFLMFSLDREDVFSYGDLGLRNAIKKLYKLKKYPSRARVDKITAKWKPYRTLASRYLWASMDTKD
jgi:DNA-3-methyladenine glycosylase II